MVANKPTPPTRNPKLSSKRYAMTTAVINNKKDAAARPADSFPFFASFFFVNEYLYLLAIMEFSPNMIADEKQNISKGCPKGVQNHIIYLKTSDLRDKLDHFYCQT